MSDQAKPAVGSVGWFDLTVDDADRVRDFYAAVVGWQPEPVSMGEYSDYAMKRPDGEAVAGVCFARGANAEQPAGWMMYIVVADLDESLRQVTARGGSPIGRVRSMGDGSRYAAFRDPSGAVAALYQAG